MRMSAGLKHKIQLVLLVAIAVAAVRTGYVLYQRHTEKARQSKAATPSLNPDYYVTPKKLHPYDLKSARQLTEQPVWVKEGYRYSFYGYDTGHHHADFAKEAGVLGPIEKLEIKDVVTDRSPTAQDQRQVLALFVKDGKTFAVPIGTEKSGEYKIYSDEMFYIEDPHQLYKHWPADIWQSIEQHEVKPGMNEIQADFAIGMGIPERSDDPAVKTVKYPNGGRPMSITYQDGKAAAIKASQ
jgi:hypothetical protein